MSTLNTMAGRSMRCALARPTLAFTICLQLLGRCDHRLPTLQRVQSCKTKKDNVGGGNTKVCTYSYSQEWLPANAISNPKNPHDHDQHTNNDIQKTLGVSSTLYGFEPQPKLGASPCLREHPALCVPSSIQRRSERLQCGNVCGSVGSYLSLSLFSSPFRFPFRFRFPFPFPLFACDQDSC
eukprot:SAG31_NODE_6125_length_2158_cov_1.239437_3_plen_181_part_00